MNRDKTEIETSPHGRTWADLAAQLPAWMIGVAALGFVGIIIYALATNSSLGVLGKFGREDGSIAASAALELPSGAVIVVDHPDGCTNGWETFAEAAGRFIVGVDGVDYRLLYEEREADYQTGGEAFVMLEEQHLPAHTHQLLWGRAGEEPEESEGRTAIGNAIRDGLLARDIPNILSTGENVAHENRPPFIALYFCKQSVSE